MKQTRTLNIYTDGGARGNPGPSAIGVYIANEQDEVLDSIGKRIGRQTNNVAEYSAILEALGWIIENRPKLPKLLRINVFMDSNLASSQLNGLYKVKNASLRSLIFEIRQKEALISLPIFYSHIPREKNRKADELVNQALDESI
ncbi:MAG: ribonuclease HI family protein [Candidatus Levybacteria bacterium]|nr:ribonuclease HI family protein [Candidatus Levybacteria bacterium]